MKTKGFTLIELLVVIAIIAILSVIGITVFSGVQRNARDAKRRGDIDAIAKALEFHYGNPTPGEYTPLNNTADWFPSGNYPQDPLLIGADGVGNCRWNPHPCYYCNRAIAGECQPQQDLNAASLNQSIGDHSPPGEQTIGQTPHIPFTAFTICANLEAGGFYCRSNQQ